MTMSGAISVHTQRRKSAVAWWLPIAALATVALTPASNAQTAAPPPPGNQFIACANPGEPLLRVPEIVTAGGRLRGAIVLSVENNRMKERTGAATNDCVLQFNRSYRAVNGTLPGYPGTVPAGFPGYAPPPPLSYASYSDPMPGPTLRARVGDIVQLSFLNQIDTGVFGNSIDRGERNDPAQGCDESSGPYPYVDAYPDCFHGSSTGNMHFHGTHTSPSTTGDNVFIEVRPSPRKNGKPVITPASVQPVFNEFFAACERALNVSQLVQWPRTWNDLPPKYVKAQTDLLKQYDANPAIKNKLWPVDQAQLKAGGWPQYYIGAYPFCYRLPAYTQSTFPPPPVPMHAGMAMPAGERPLLMGQSPGTHWYHAHKHGSTTINVTNGMVGAFIIEGKYDDDLNAFYGGGWTRTQPLIEITELLGPPNLYTGGAGTGANKIAFTVNGRPQPTISMKSGEVQLWRIVNTAARSGAYFVPPVQGLQWKQLAQDGVQFSPSRYWNNQDQAFLMTSANRVDLLVKAPANTGTTALAIPVQVRKAVNTAQTTTGAPATLLTVMVQPGATVTGNPSQFVPQAQAPTLPPFLQDIKASEVTGTKRVVFESHAPVTDASHPLPVPNGAPFTEHTIDGKKFDGDVGEVVLLNTVEEWTIVNRTVAPAINHPFHIHINPFQVVEVFDPLAPQRDASGNVVLDGAGKALPHYVVTATAPANLAQGSARDLTTGQCWVNLLDEGTWKPCPVTAPAAQQDNIWWDVFPIPAGVTAKDASGKAIVVPGYFKMRSRFVDYSGLYVIHCHILAHEDRGMMNIVEVVPYKTIYAHH
jgi:FtsP/CotA-like multicopper oxidase with cupredoxin domain